MVTKEELERLRAARPKDNYELHYTIDGPAKAYVHSSLEAERIGKINRGDRVMKEASQNFKRNIALKTRKGQAKAQFKAADKPFPGIDTDLGYGAGKEHASVKQHYQDMQRKTPTIERER